MTQEDKQLLWADICARFPYEVKIQYDSQTCKLVAINDDYTVLLLGEDGHKPNIEDDLFLNIEDTKPYLRPMSSMTEEELKEFKSILNYDGTCDCFLIALKVGKIIDTNFVLLVDWLNKKMFDYRGLIPKGAALEAPEEMYEH